MANRLVDRNKQIPNGYKFYQPETKWKSPPFPSFNSLVDQVYAHRRGNPALAKQYGWAMDKPSIEQEVEAFNVRLCEAMGWSAYVMGGDAPLPKSNSPLQSLRNVAAGGKIVVEMLKDGEAVSPELSEKRASICAVRGDGKKCPKNDKGDWTRFFTVPASAAIRKALEVTRGMNLKTSYDDHLGICTACNCPLKLKVHFPIDRILRGLTSEQRADLDPLCWILAESK